MIIQKKGVHLLTAPRVACAQVIDIPPHNATITRMVTIVSPCADDENLCDDGSCSSVACDQRAMVGVRVGNKKEPPRIMLNPMFWNDSMDDGAGQPFAMTFLKGRVRADISALLLLGRVALAFGKWLQIGRTTGRAHPYCMIGSVTVEIRSARRLPTHARVCLHQLL